MGSPEQCAKRVVDQFDCGADGVILHGASPAELEPIVKAYEAIRPRRALKAVLRIRALAP